MDPVPIHARLKNFTSSSVETNKLYLIQDILTT